jgi:integrase
MVSISYELAIPFHGGNIGHGANVVPRAIGHRTLALVEVNNGEIHRPEDVVHIRGRRGYPAPRRRGNWWTIQARQDVVVDGELKRSNKRVRLGPATMPEREVRKVAAEYLGPLNQGIQGVGSAVSFAQYVQREYLPVVMPLFAKSTRDRYEGVLENYIVPTFGELCLRDITPLAVQKYFSQMTTSPLTHESRDKIRDVLSSVLASAVRYGFLVRNHVESVRMPSERRGRRRNKPYLTVQQFSHLIELIPEPYASMVYVAIYTGLRVSEFAGLRWDDIHEDSITIDERYCRGDWGCPKSDCSNATIAVNRCVIERIHRLKTLKVEVRAGRAVREYRAVKSDGPSDLVFQSVKDGKPIRDNNILTRFIKPAARKIGLEWVHWRSLRTSHAVWLKLVGADVKDAQGQMRHSRASTTLDIYQQFVPESQRRVVTQLSSLSTSIN